MNAWLVTYEMKQYVGLQEKFQYLAHIEVECEALHEHKKTDKQSLNQADYFSKEQQLLPYFRGIQTLFFNLSFAIEHQQPVREHKFWGKCSTTVVWPRNLGIPKKFKLKRFNNFSNSVYTLWHKSATGIGWNRMFDEMH